MAYETPSVRSKPVAGAFIVKHGQAIPDDGSRMFYYQDGVRYIRGSKGPRRAARQGPDGRAEEAAYKISLDWAAKQSAGCPVTPHPATVPALGARIEPGPMVPTEDTVVLRMGRRTAEVLRTVLQYVGGPFEVNTPRERVERLDLQMSLAGVRLPQESEIHVAPAVGLSHKRAIGLRMRWPNGTPFAPPDVAEEKPSEKPSSYYHVTSTPVRTGGPFLVGDIVRYQSKRMIVIGGWLEDAVDDHLIRLYGKENVSKKRSTDIRVTDGRVTHTVRPEELSIVA